MIPLADLTRSMALHDDRRPAKGQAGNISADKIPRRLDRLHQRTPQFLPLRGHSYGVLDRAGVSCDLSDQMQTVGLPPLRTQENLITRSPSKRSKTHETYYADGQSKIV